jgi:hypothetical protein
LKSSVLKGKKAFCFLFVVLASTLLLIEIIHFSPPNTSISFAFLFFEAGSFCIAHAGLEQ